MSLITDDTSQPPRRFEVGKVEDFPIGKFRIIECEGRQIGIIRMDDGEMHAVLNRCPHKGAPVCRGIVGGTWPPSAVGELSFERDGQVLTCPWHGFEFDLSTGAELFQERPMRLRKYRTTTEGGSVFLML
jgi:nitrite reductase (NADH) small subunit